MRSSRLCFPAVALLLLGCLLFAPGLAASSSGPIPVSGQVLGPGSVPLAGARVLLVPVPSLAASSRLELEGKADLAPAVSVSTDADGSFLLAAPEPGMWKVVVEARGMVSREKQLLPLIEETELPALQLERDAGLEVRVVGPDGGALPGARVQVRGSRGPRELLAAGWQARDRSARTDEKGVAVLPREAGETLFVQAGGEGRPVAAQNEVKGPSVTLRLPAGTARQIQVVDAAGKPGGKTPVAGVFVHVGDERWCAGRTSAEGLFSVPLPEGRKRETLLLVADDGRMAEASLTPPAREDKGPQVLSLPALETVDGRVVSAADGQPVAGALVWNLDPGTFRRSGPDGSYRLAGVQGFPRVVQAAAPGFLIARGGMSSGGLPQGPTVALEPSWAAGGVVQDEQGQPVAGVTVRALPQPSTPRPDIPEVDMARTAPSGRFRLRRLESGIPYRLQLAKRGFAPATAELPPLVPGRPVSDLRIVLRKGRTGFGRVVNRAEQPVPGARIVLRPALSGSLQMRMTLSLHSDDTGYEAVTGSDGRFEVRDLPAGAWELAIQARGYAPLRVPGLGVPEGGGSTDLGTIILAPGAPVEGHVVDREGRPIAGAEVQVSEAEAFFASFLDPDPSPVTVTAADGFFRIEDRREGETIHLVASREGYAPAGLPGVTVPAEEPVRIVLQAASAVEGTTVGADGEPLANIMIFVIPDDLMTMAALGTAGVSHPEPAMSRADGSFRIENVAPGRIELHAMALGRQQALLKNLEVQPGKDLTGVEIVLAPGAVVAGRVLAPSGKPVAGAEVNVMGSDTSMSLLNTTTSDGEGRYRLEGISPGSYRIEATHKSYLPARRQLAVRAGDNALDFTFEEGSAQISGRVVDEAGAPVAGARVSLQKEWDPSGLPSSSSDADGAFTLSGVPDGVYQLFAEKQGFARSREGKLIAVDGSSVGGIEVRLIPGGSIVGRILGLDFAELSQVQVMADAQLGQVRPDGSYRIDHVGPGKQRVMAFTSGRERQAGGQVVLEPGVSEVRLDLEFGEGFTLSGRVLLNGEPLRGENLHLHRRTGFSSHWMQSDHEGRFRVEGLEAGSYDLRLHGSGARLHEEELEITADREILIEIRAASIAGRVVDAADRRPLANARVAAAPAEDAVKNDHAQAGTTTDSRGAFVLRDVPEGVWTVEASLAGFAPAEVVVQAAAGAPVEGVELALQAMEGLTLEVVLPSGQSPGAVGVWILDPAGRLVSSGVHPVGEGGRVRITDVPSGVWELLLDVAGSPLLSLPVTVPGHTGRVVLPQPSALDLRVVPLLEEGIAAKVRLTDEIGRMFRVPGPGGALSELVLNAGAGRFERIPAGTWRITVTTADGRIWTEHAVLPPGETARVALEAPR